MTLLGPIPDGKETTTAVLADRRRRASKPSITLFRGVAARKTFTLDEMDEDRAT